MHTSSLLICLQSFQEGDSACIAELCKQLANRILFIPTTDVPTDDLNSETKVNVIEIREAYRSVIPVFTGEQEFKTWSVEQNHQGGFIRLMGSDLCMVISGNKWLRLNEGLETETELQPTIVKNVIEFAFENSIVSDHEGASYLERYSLENSFKDSSLEFIDVENPIQYHGRVNERDFLKIIPIQKSSEVQEVINKQIEENEEDTIKNEQIELPELIEQKTQATTNIRAWDESDNIRKRKKTTQEGTSGAMEAWNMLKECPPLGSSVPVESISDKAVKNQTKIKEIENLSAKDLSLLSKKLQKEFNNKSQTDQTEDKSIWSLFK